MKRTQITGEEEEAEMNSEESPHGRQSEGPKGPWLIALTVAIVAIFATVVALAPSISRQELMKQAKRTLRQIGSAQLAYQGSNNDKHHGTFKALQADGYFEKSDTLGTMIPSYTINWKIWNNTSGVGITTSGSGPWVRSNSFTIIAYPHVKRPRGLKTFAIAGDQVLREYNPDNGNVLESVSTWDKVPE